MKIEEIVLTIEQAKHLQELGLDMNDAALCWIVGEITFQDTNIRHQSVVTMDSKPQQYAFVKEITPTYTLQEVLNKIPNGRTNYQDEDSVAWYDRNAREINFFVRKDKFDNTVNSLDAAYKMLCWLLGNGYYKE